MKILVGLTRSTGSAVLTRLLNGFEGFDEIVVVNDGDKFDGVIKVIASREF